MAWSLKLGDREIALVREVFVLGRDRAADLHLDDPQVSRRHARIRWLDGAPTVEDLGSRNGTYRNRVRLVAETVLGIGDVLGIGPFELVLLPRTRSDDVNMGIEPATLPMPGAKSLETLAPHDPLAVLSPREREIFTCLARGATGRDIAAQLGISVKTIETHRTRIGQKLGVRTRAELLRIALELGVLRSRTPG